MSENKKPWNEKLKLVLNELEDKIGAESEGTARNRRIHRKNMRQKQSGKRRLSSRRSFYIS